MEIKANNIQLSKLAPLNFASTNKISDNKNIKLFNTTSAKPVDKTPEEEKGMIIEALKQGKTEKDIRNMLKDFEFIFDIGITYNNLIIYEKPDAHKLMNISVYDADWGDNKLKRCSFSKTVKGCFPSMMDSNNYSRIHKNYSTLYLLDETSDKKNVFNEWTCYISEISHDIDTDIDKAIANYPNQKRKTSNIEYKDFNDYSEFVETRYFSNGQIAQIRQRNGKTAQTTNYYENGNIRSEYIDDINSKNSSELYYSENGKLYAKVEDNGKEKVTIHYYDNGNIKSELVQENKNTLKEVYYDENGKVKAFKDFVNKKCMYNSKVKNSHYEGKEYQVKRKDNIITITDHNNQNKTKLDIDVLFKNFSEEEKQKSTEALLKLPAECLIDLSKEISSLEINTYTQYSGVYSVEESKIYVDPDLEALAHELGHAISYDWYSQLAFDGYNNVNLPYSPNYDSEMKKYLADGKKRYVETNSPRTIVPKYYYATMNKAEMFAECYQLLMTGNCMSKTVIEAYFPQTLEDVKKYLEEIRKLPDEDRFRRR